MKSFLKKLERVFSVFERSPKAERRYQIVWNVVLILMILMMVGASFGAGIGAGYFASTVRKDPIRSKEQLTKQLYTYEQTSEIYFANDVYLGKFRTDLEREEVSLKDVSPLVLKAVIATEDEHFYEHNGVVPKAIIRAILQEALGSTTQTGGSTLTQQLVKQQILTSEVSFERKFKEILLAQRMEKFFSKDQILEAYLNVSPFGRNSSGRNIAGVQTASKGIFGVPANKLTLPQAAFIAGLPQNPYQYTPFTQFGKQKENLAPGIERMNVVLQRMYHHGDISEAEYNEAKSYDITKDFIKPKKSGRLPYPYIVAEVEKRAKEILVPLLAKKDGVKASELKKDKNLRAEYNNLADAELRNGGYKIHTTIDKGMYDAMEKATDNFKYYQPAHTVRKKNYDTKKWENVKEPVEVGAVLIENKTGKILSFVGGRDFTREQLNHATTAKRSNGSTMKPLLVYGPAIEYRMSSPDKTLINAPININGWKPSNYGGGSYTGTTSTRQALKFSYNIPAILQYKEILSKRPATFLKKMGFSSLKPEDYENISTGIGALEDGVTVEENTNAYTTFVNNGNFIDAYMIEKIEDANGKTIFQQKKKETKVFSGSTAYQIRSMLRDVVNGGTAASLKGKLNLSSDWIGKTGTGQGYRDAWFVGSNPTITMGTWMGYDTQDNLNKFGGMAYNQRNLNLWASLFNAAYKVNPKAFTKVEKFVTPSSVSYASFSNYKKVTKGKDGEEEITYNLYGTKYLIDKRDLDPEKKKKEEKEKKKEKKKKEEEEKKNREAAEKQETVPASGTGTSGTGNTPNNGTKPAQSPSANPAQTQ